MAKMNDQEFRSIVDQEVQNATAWSASTMLSDRERNIAYYHGMPMGNEVDGRSQVVSWDVFEVVESTIPDLLEPFFSADDIGEFEPVEESDDAYCTQATEYVNWLIKKKNPGFIIFNTWIKDGLQSKVGIVRSWWDATVQVKKEKYRGLTDDQLTQLLDNDNIELLSSESIEDPDDTKQREQAQLHLTTLPPEQQAPILQMLQQPPKMLYNIEIQINKGPVGVCIDNIPPESFILSRKAKKITEATIIGEHRRYTKSDLVEMGFKQDRVDALSDFDVGTIGLNQNNDLLMERDEDNIDVDDESEGAMQTLKLFFGFVRVDMDGDGVAEWRRVFLAGNDTLENEECDDQEYSLWSPIMLPHRVIGLALADVVAPIQEVQTVLSRQYLDSLYMANNPTSYAIEGKVNLDDLLSTRIGKVVRIKEAGAAGALTTTMVASEALNGIEYMKSMREERTGVTRLNQGLDADSLNKTATGVNKIMNAGDRRKMMMLRIFAETGCKDLFKKVLKLTCMYQDKPATIRMNKKWVEYDPRMWSPELDFNINLGAGSDEKNMQFMALFGQFMDKAAPSGVVQPQNVYEFGKRLLKYGKFQGGEMSLLTDPAKIPPKETPPDPAIVLAQAEVEKAKIGQETAREKHQMEMQSKALDRQLKEQEIRGNALIKGLELQLKEKEIRIKEIDLGLKNVEMENDMQLRREKAVMEELNSEREAANG